MERNLKRLQGELDLLYTLVRDHDTTTCPKGSDCWVAAMISCGAPDDTASSGTCSDDDNVRGNCDNTSSCLMFVEDLLGELN
jgi:hypothetical protein